MTKEDDLNSARFLASFARIERHLRNTTTAARDVPFYQLVERARERDSAVRSREADIKEFADLRNAIVHERRGGKVIAEPNDEAVSEIESLANLLVAPPKVRTVFRKIVMITPPNEHIGRAAQVMTEGSFSQLPVYDEKHFVGLLTSNTVARWLGAQLDVGLADMTTSVKEVLRHQEEDNFEFIQADKTLFDLRVLFTDEGRRRRPVEAVLITASGSRRDKPLGIATTWDLPRVHDLLFTGRRH